VDAADELARALGTRALDVAELVRRAEAGAYADAEETLRRLLAEDLLRRAAAHLAGRRVLALVGVGEGVRPIARELDESALHDERRLEAEVRTHNELLLDAMGRGAVVPFRFGTAFPDEDALHAWLGEHRDALALELERLRGKAEWTVEVTAAEAAATPERYLEERLATATRADVRERIAAVADERNGNAYLLADARRAELEALLAELEAEGYELRISGPWPPYSFTRPL
jgi:hypothetical protein